jgi:hypothetical protein
MLLAVSWFIRRSFTPQVTETEGLYTGKNEFKKGYQTRVNLLEDEKGDPLVDSLNILKKWKNHFSHLLSDMR